MRWWVLPAINWGVGTGNVITNISNVANIFNAWPLIGTASADARYQLKAGSLVNSLIQINFSSYPKGVYFIQLTTATTNSVQR